MKKIFLHIKLIIMIQEGLVMDNGIAFFSQFISMLLTIISGVVVFIVGQLFIEYGLKPIQEYKKLKSKIAYTLTYYACYFCNPIKPVDDKDNNWEKTSIALREMAAEVDAFAQIRPCCSPFIASKKTLIKVSSNLIGLSNCCFQNSPNFNYVEHNIEYKNEIYKLLKLKK